MNEDTRDELREEYDFSEGVRGKYAARTSGAVVVLLDPDIAQEFPDAISVNAALRELLKQRSGQK